MSGKDDPFDKDGVRNDGVRWFEAGTQRLHSYEAAEHDLSLFSAPLLVHSDNPHEHIFIAPFDGTGNDKFKDPQHETNVGKISDQIDKLNSRQIHAGYVAGPGTQEGWWARTRDGATGHTYEPRVEEMYKQLIDIAASWKQDDPQSVISIAELGFSRGGPQAAGLARIVEERGIQNPDGAVYTRDANGLISGVTYTKPPLVAPGQVAQVEVLFDPVSTGEPLKHDRRPPPSVISGLQIIAEDERRGLFKSDHIIDPGLTPDGRFLGVTVAGAHSDVGGSYHRDGLAARSENLAINYLNSLSDKPFLQNVAEPNDPRLNVVHQSEEGMLLYRIAPKVNRDLPEGYNERLVPQETHRTTQMTPHGFVSTLTRVERPGVGDPFNAEPRNEALNAQFERQPVRIGTPPNALSQTQTDPAPLDTSPSSITRFSSTNAMFDGLYAAAAKSDSDGMRAVSGAYLESPQGQAWLTQGQQFNLEANAQQAAMQAQAQQAAQPQPNLGFGL